MANLFQNIEPHPQAPLGIHWHDDVITLGIYVKNAKTVEFFFYDIAFCTELKPQEPLDFIVLESDSNFGEFWGVRAKLTPSTFRKFGVAIRIWIPTEDVTKAFWILDPYMRESIGGQFWGNPRCFEFTNAHARMTIKPHVEHPSRTTRRLQVIRPSQYKPRPLKPDTPRERTVIYECHTRGITKHPSAQFASPHSGTFRGLTELIPHLKDLGITAIQLMPVFDFDESENPFSAPDGSKLYNFWGYSPINFFGIKQNYAYDKAHPCDEFKFMVDCFHYERIEVYLDVVFNHTAEGGAGGAIDHFKVLNPDWYHFDEQGNFQNYSGCGNSVNASHPAVRTMIADSLSYWSNEMGVDGFRFDLACVLNRDEGGRFVERSSFFRALQADPRLQGVKLIVEPWDAAGGYQLGDFAYHADCMEWNGQYRDAVRCAIRGDHGVLQNIKNCLLGSPHIYQSPQKGQSCSVNFVTAHDGMTLWDLTVYNTKHNEANGEDNRDGTNNDYSHNCGVEGETDDVEINHLRLKKMRMAYALTLISSGIPMFLAGDEFARTQQGNNNAYALDNEISWVNWDLKAKNESLFQFVKSCIAFRQLYRNFFDVRHAKYEWFNSEGKEEDLGHYIRTLAFQLSNDRQEYLKNLKLYVTLNFHEGEVQFTLPKGNWQLVLNSAPDTQESCEKRMPANLVSVPAFSLQVFKQES